MVHPPIVRGASWSDTAAAAAAAAVWSSDESRTGSPRSGKERVRIGHLSCLVRCRETHKMSRAKFV